MFISIYNFNKFSVDELKESSVLYRNYWISA